MKICHEYHNSSAWRNIENENGNNGESESNGWRNVEISRSENGESMIFNGRNEMKAGNQLNGENTKMS
jgi:hypothetical protein